MQNNFNFSDLWRRLVGQSAAPARAPYVEPASCDGKACYVLDKHDEEVVYRVIGAPSSDAAVDFLMKKLRRRGGAGLRDWPLSRLDEFSPGEIISVRYKRGGHAAPRRRSKARKRKR